MTITSTQIDQAGVHAEVSAVALAYERALMAGDVATLDSLFWNDPRLVRYGIADIQHGFDEVAAFRAALPRQSPPRSIARLDIRTFGNDLATVQIEFRYADQPRRGRQTQTWVRLDVAGHGGWRVVAAHVDTQPER